MSGAIHEVKGWRRLAMLPLSCLIRIWSTTLRFQIDEDSLNALRPNHQSTLMLFWHNRLFLATEVLHRYRKERTACALVSASKDGSWLAALYGLLGLEAIRGSSSWRGREALTEVIQALESNKDVGLTPDGPRGPKYRMKNGPLYLLEQSKCSLILVSATFQSAWRFNSWDRFYLPKPFSKVVLRAKYYKDLSSFQSMHGEDNATQTMQDQLRSLNEA